MTKNKITTDMIQEGEADMLIDALGNCLELTDDFLAHYCSEDFRKLMLPVPEHGREYILSGINETHRFNGFPPSGSSQDILLDISEIEYQFEGAAKDALETPDDFTIDGNLAYLYVGYGLSITFDRVQLLQAITDYISLVDK